LAILFGINYLVPVSGIIGFVFKIALTLLIPNAIIYLLFKNNAEFKIFSELIKATFTKLRG
jgi:hypothetical protein